MDLNRDACYRAVLARDVRYDGRFFTCVKTTGIYCRPICPARTPKMENCRFVATAAAAHIAGFRPCLRCRPESSPDLDAWRGTSATVSRALKMIEGGALDDGDVAALADRLAIGERQLRRLFQRHLGAAPVTVAQTRRVLLARQLLQQTDFPMIEVALASGFGSVRRFNEIFQQLYGRPPGDMRRGKYPSTGSKGSSEISLLLPYRPPFDWDSMIRFHQARAIPGLESVTGGRYSRVIELAGSIGFISVGHAPEQSALRVEIRFPELNALPAIIARVRRMFDLSADPGAICAVLKTDPLLAPLVAARPGLRLPGAWDGFELAIRAVLGQQITVKAARHLAARLVADYGVDVSEKAGRPDLTHAFPRPEKFVGIEEIRLGMPKARACALSNIAAAKMANPRLFDPYPDLDRAVTRLSEIPGIGQWTAQYIAMRALGETDAFLAGDVGVQKWFVSNGKRPRAADLLARAESWRPWRAYAVLHLWMADSTSRKGLETEKNYAPAS
jgi:AraC family transcriptional regulator of adaptative response / DNA-3-methyladenine glycosylase II